ncbi:MAG TPA: hypothetical protein VK772_09620 [Puia sp.]|jgi:hypothetical protein|nr:hypothetical protein [Puia sp.]
MLRSVSWQNFLALTGILLAIYYVIILMMYYRIEIVAFFRSPKKWKNIFQKPSSPKEKNNTEDFFASVLTLKKEVDHLISNSYYRRTNKEDLFFVLREHLENYMRLPESFRVTINNHIQSAGEKTGSFHFTTEELSMLWRAGE